MNELKSLLVSNPSVVQIGDNNFFADAFAIRLYKSHFEFNTNVRGTLRVNYSILAFCRINSFLS